MASENRLGAGRGGAGRDGTGRWRCETLSAGRDGAVAVAV